MQLCFKKVKFSLKDFDVGETLLNLEWKDITSINLIWNFFFSLLADSVYIFLVLFTGAYW
jgi:hypothetical protein